MLACILCLVCASDDYLHCRCDADPNTLARYVTALIKKEKPADELRKQCLKKLQIFLQTREELLLLFTSVCVCMLHVWLFCAILLALHYAICILLEYIKCIFRPSLLSIGCYVLVVQQAQRHIEVRTTSK